jgi:hypothetical protein
MSEETNVIKESLEEIQKEISSLSDKLSILYKKRDKLKMSRINYKGKYLYHKRYGYIYVQSQFVDYEQFVLQGFTFNFSISPYMDDFYYKVDALSEWHIRFSDVSFEKEVKEITKEEFLEEFNKALDAYRKEAPGMLEYCFNEAGK